MHQKHFKDTMCSEAHTLSCVQKFPSSQKLSFSNEMKDDFELTLNQI